MYLPHQNLGLKDGKFWGKRPLALPTLGNALIFKNPFPSCENCIFNSKAINKPQQQGGVGWLLVTTPLKALPYASRAH